METLLTPLRAASSRPAQRAYLTTLLLLITAAFLLFVAASSYILFYIHYIPPINHTHPLHLQYTPTHHPTALYHLPPASTIPHQLYTVTLHLRLPSSTTNIALGNFMTELTLLSPRGTTLSHSRRSAALTYRTPLLSTLDTLLRAPLYLSHLQAQQETLHVRLIDDTAFPEEVGAVKATLETVAGPITVYDAVVEFRARFEGLRWVMFNYRVLTFVLATALFWGVECALMVLAWWAVYSYFASGAGGMHNGGMDGDVDVDEGEDEDEDVGVMAYPSPPAEDGVSVYADDEETEGSEGGAVVGEIVADSGLGSMSESASSARARARAVGEGGQRRRRSRNAG